MATLLSTLLAASLMAGCGSTGTTESAATATENTAAESTAESAVESEAEAADESTAATDESVAEEAEAEIVKSSERETAYGKVVGQVTNDVEIYYGVPYGADTAGENRWKAPQAPEAWTETRDCTTSADIAVQLGTVTDEKGESVSAAVGTTDCLHLDIYTKADAKALPVLVYVHGGNNQTGKAAEIPGTDMVVKDDIVYVSLDYRLGLQGFNCLPALLEDGETGNFTMLDLAAALQWVRDNIANFGGDPANVTISGFSAGGRDVMAMLLSPTFEGLFDKAIAFSGGMTIADVDASIIKIADAIAPLAVEDGKAATDAEAAEWLKQDNEEVKEYLYSISDERLAPLCANAGIRMSVFPHLYADGIVLPAEGFDSNSYINDVPLMMLTGSSEFTFFGCTDPYFETIEDTDQKAAAVTFTDTYGSDFYRVFNTQLSAEKMDAAYNSDMYLVQVNYGGQNSASTIPLFGAFHGIFVPMLSSVNGYSTLYDFSAAGYQDMADKYNAYLKNFLTTGNPNGEGLDVEWPTWTSADKQTLILDADATTASVTTANVFKSNEEIISALDADETVTAEQKDYIIKNIMNGRWFSADLDAHTGAADLWASVNAQ